MINKLYATAFGAAGIAVACFVAGANYRSSQVSPTVVRPSNQDSSANYVCPMHPAISSKSPADCPACGMKLELEVTKVRQTIRLSNEEERLAGIRSDDVSSASQVSIRVVPGRVSADETRIRSINVPVAGWVENVTDTAVGQRIKKGELLAKFYTPELMSRERALVFALETIDKMASSNNEADKNFNQPNLNIAAGVLGLEANSGKIDAKQGIVQGPVENLRNLGMADDQIVHIASTREVTRTIYISSPIGGYLLTRSISKGQRFMEGTEFFQIADLSTVWVIAEVLDSDTQALQPGTNVRVRTADGKHQATAVVSNALAVANPSTRTSKIRLIVSNAERAFTPGAAVDVILSVAHQPALSIPADALIDTGKATYVFVHGADGSYSRRNVVVERHRAGRIVIKSGLKRGERVVTAGNFLIDSESRLRRH